MRQKLDEVDLGSIREAETDVSEFVGSKAIPFLICPKESFEEEGRPVRSHSRFKVLI